MYELLIFILVGILFGIITGLTPGIHTNLLAVFLLSISPMLLNYFSPIAVIVLIVSMGLTNTFIDAIPSIYLGAPDEENSLSVLPGHKMLLEGRGHEAVQSTLIGSIIAVIIFLLITPLLIFIIPKIQNLIEKMMAFFLIWAVIFLLIREEERKKAFIIFILSGILGIASTNLSINQPLLPLLTGLFGTSTLIYSISQNSSPPEQKIEKTKINLKEIKKPFLATAIVSPICSFMPGMGASQSAIIGTSFFKKISQKEFLILVGSTNTLVLSVSFLILYLTNKKRSGLAAAISQLTTIGRTEMTYIIGTIILTTIICFLLTIKISKFFAKNITKINYEKLSKGIIFFLFLVVFLVSGFKGILVLVSSTLLGLTASYLGVRKGFLMGCLMLPAILWYLPI
ncbi:MAG: tripartite tricarboxylate transporter permease [Candidatus Pacearchaeota archaeon]